MTTAARLVAQSGLVLLLSLGGSTLAWGQAAPQPDGGPAAEERPFNPPNEELNRDLDETLREEYSEPADLGADVPGVDYDSGGPDTMTTSRTREDEGGIKLRLRGLAVYWNAHLDEVEISKRQGTSGGQDVELTDRRDASDERLYDYEGVNTGIYQLSLDIGKYLAVRGGYRDAVFYDRQVLHRDGVDTFTYGRTTFRAGDQVKTHFELQISDLDFVFKPLNNSWVTLDLSLGLRHAKWRTELIRERGGSFDQLEDRLEAVIPMAGVGLALRPVKQLELFARVRVGHFEYERDEREYRRRGRRYRVEAKERESSSAEVDIGISFVLAETIGVTAGYRLDYLEMSREVDARAERVEGVVHGLYVGGILQF